MPSQLASIQQEILRRFQRPPSGEQSPDAQQGQQRSVFAPPQQPQTASAEQWHAPMADNSTPGPFRPPGNRLPATVDAQPMQPSPTIQPSVFAPPSVPTAADAPPAVMPLEDPRTGAPNRQTHNKLNPNDRLKADTEYRDALDVWKPRGGRGFKQVLKEGLIGGANAMNANPDNPWAAIGGLGAGIGSGVVQPNAITREFELGKANQDIAKRIGEQHARATVDNLGMVPVSMPDGQGGYVQAGVPRAKVASVLATNERNRQGEDRNAIMSARTDGYLEHLERLKGDAKKKLTAQLYKTGALNTPKGLKYAAETLEIPVDLREAFVRGEMRDAVDDEGNLIEVNRRTGASSGVTGSNGQPVKSFKTVEERGKDQRAANVQIGQDRRLRAGVGGMKSTDLARAAQLMAAANDAYDTEINYNKTRGKNAPVDPAFKAQAQSKRENAQTRAYNAFPGLFEDDGTGHLRMKAQAQPQSTGAGPQGDGKHHYTPDQIRAKLRNGQTYEDAVQKLKAYPNVVIDE